MSKSGILVVRRSVKNLYADWQTQESIIIGRKEFEVLCADA